MFVTFSYEKGVVHAQLDLNLSQITMMYIRFKESLVLPTDSENKEKKENH